MITSKSNAHLCIQVENVWKDMRYGETSGFARKSERANYRLVDEGFAERPTAEIYKLKNR